MIRISHCIFLFFLSIIYIVSLPPLCALVLQALQYVQENSDEVCPAGWKPGEKSMKPDPKLSKDYFAGV
ncbi:hypothetical protein JHK82_012596 [Glycine max]|uniref:thioredoxin-dependent peroxiredoxin n=1 Tax=Glycine soja TaxID=3848 RepID=A0A0B2S1Q0_GLYSO|nr:hypothetical protein JHK86_012611 [Glycine max]KAG5154627.1 hypothetical protein JHK82_012596 [Glycine max]KHN38603.1 2-Cys peroxiredoxin BAS1-like, chloroplastic [Glycine soja]